MNNFKQLYARKNVRVFIWFSLIMLGFGVVAVVLQPVLVSLILSLALYALFEPVNIALLRRGWQPGYSALVVVLAILLLLYAAVSIVVPLFTEQFYLLLDRMPVILSSLQQMGNRLSDTTGIPFDVNLLLQTLDETLKRSFSKIFFHGSSFIANVAYVFILVPVFTFFLLKEFQQMRNWSLSTLPNNTFELGWVIYRRVAKKLQEYIRGLMIQSLIVGIICSSGFMLMGLESALLLGTLAGLLNVIPYIGPLFAMILPVLVVMSHVPFEPLLIVAAIGTVLTAQLIDNFFVIPVVIANAVNLHPMIVIVGLIIFGTYFGLLGMLVAIPVLATAKIILHGLSRGLQVQPA